MEFVRLGPAYSSTYIPDKLIEGYTSLIWTERQQDFGEFELKSPMVDDLKTLLPVDTLVSHLETQEVMIVESHSIEMVGEGADAMPEITIKGRSASVILTHRFVESRYQQKRRMRMKYSAAAAVQVLLYNAVDNVSGKDVTRGDTSAATADGNDYSWTTKDAIPNVVVSHSVPVVGATRRWYLTQGNLYPQLQEIMKAQELGIRCLRPVLPNIVTVVTVASSLSSRGEVTRTAVNNVAALQFNVYDGINRASSVKFSMLQGHIVSPQYLVSTQEYKTSVEVMSSIVPVRDVTRAGEEGFTGWKRKVAEVDAGKPEKPVKPVKPKRPKSTASATTKRNYEKARDKYLDDKAVYDVKKYTWDDEFREEAVLKARDVLYQTRKVDMFAGDISTNSPYTYGVHYDLGDIVTLVDQYGRTAPMIVREYVRTEDESGDRGFPGLVAP